jgi:hypothetical protein
VTVIIANGFLFTDEGSVFTQVNASDVHIPIGITQGPDIEPEWMPWIVQPQAPTPTPVFTPEPTIPGVVVVPDVPQVPGTVAQTPEPATMALSLAALVVAALWRMR